MNSKNWVPLDKYRTLQIEVKSCEQICDQIVNLYRDTLKTYQSTGTSYQHNSNCDQELLLSLKKQNIKYQRQVNAYRRALKKSNQVMLAEEKVVLGYASKHHTENSRLPASLRRVSDAIEARDKQNVKEF